MVGTGIWSNIMRSPSPECYTTFWMMTIYSDTLHWSGITPIFDPITDLEFITFYRVVRGFHRTFATGAACKQRTLTLPDTWSCPIWDLRSSFCWDHWHSIIHYTTNSWPFLWFDILPNFDSFPWFDTWHTNHDQLDLTFRILHYWIKVSIGHLQRVWHADRGRLLLRTPGPVPLWGLQAF